MVLAGVESIGQLSPHFGAVPDMLHVLPHQDFNPIGLLFQTLGTPGVAAIVIATLFGFAALRERRRGRHY